MNKHVMKATLIGAAAVALLSAPRVHAVEPIVIRVSPRVATEPATLLVDAVVERNHDNRGLEIQIDSGDYYRSSLMQLDGEQAPRTTSMRYEGVPGGTYEVRATLLGVDGKPRASTAWNVTIISLVGR